MSMNKAIHAAFRRDLDRFASALADFDAGDRDRARSLHRAWENFEDQLTHHHHGEHEIAWPALASIGVDRDLLAAMDGEHDVMADALAEAGATLAALAASASGEDADAAGAAVARLRDVTVAHLDHEEAELEEVYLAHRETPEMKAMGKAFARVSPARGGRFFAWILDGASPDERAAVTSEVPGPVLAALTTVFGRGYRKNIAPVWR